MNNLAPIDNKIKAIMLTAMAFMLYACAKEEIHETMSTQLKPRLVVMTDIGPADVEPDDNESAVRLLAYADRYEIEAIITSIGWNCDPYPEEWAEYLYGVIDGYDKDVKNLMRRSGQSGFMPIEAENKSQELGYWPSSEYIRSRAMMGSKRAGIGIIGPDNDSAGSNFLIQLVDEDDPRPIYITSWGGANTLAQAIWKVKETRSEDDLKAFLNKIRLYTITDQDMRWDMRMDRAYSSHQWLRKEFKDDLLLVWDESAWLTQNALGVENWEKYAGLIQNHGEMGKVYPHYLWGVEGDTPSFLNCMPNGLNDPDDPTQVGWGGYHVFDMSPDSTTYAWTNWQEPVKSISYSYERRFYPDEFNDFAARMAWAQDGQGNTNPIVIVNGRGGLAPIEIGVESGQNVILDASESYDPEGDNLRFDWWIQARGDVEHADLGSSAQICYQMPVDISDPLHIICEVHDDGPFELVSYRRIILEPTELSPTSRRRTQRLTRRSPLRSPIA